MKLTYRIRLKRRAFKALEGGFHAHIPKRKTRRNRHSFKQRWGELNHKFTDERGIVSLKSKADIRSYFGIADRLVKAAYY